MASIRNRSPYLVSGTGIEPKQFSSKAQADRYVETLIGVKNVACEQLNNSWQCIVRRRDKNGKEITKTGTFDSEKEAIDFAEREEVELKAKKKGFGFDIEFETMTFEKALIKCCEEHYKKMACYKNHLLKIPIITSYFGKKKLLKDVEFRELRIYANELAKPDSEGNSGLAPSTIRDYFSLISRTFKVARSKWLMDGIQNPCVGLDLERPDNAVIRNFRGDEYERLITSIKKNCPRILNPVLLSLELTYRRGAIVPKYHIDYENTPYDKMGGIVWEGVDFEDNTITVFSEKSDHTKKSYEKKGKTVPMTVKAREVLMEEFEKSGRTSGLVFQGLTGGYITKKFKMCCDLAEPPISGITFHTMRKVSTTNWAKKFKSPLMVQKISSHKDITTLSTRYFDLDLEDLRDVMDAHDDGADDVLRAVKLLKTELGIDRASFVIRELSNTDINEDDDVFEVIKNLRNK